MSANESSTNSAAETLDAIIRELTGLSDPKILAVNEKHGDDHSANLTNLRAVAKRLKKNHPLALELWDLTPVWWTP